MAHVTRIKAKDPRNKQDAGKEPEPEAVKKPKSQKPEKVAEKATSGAVAASEKIENKKPEQETIKEKKTIIEAEVTSKAAKKAKKMAAKDAKKANKKPMSLPVRIITWPFRYVHESWLELRQVRWPSRGAAWKMVLAVVIYTGLFVGFIMILDALFTLLFNNILSK